MKKEIITLENIISDLKIVSYSSLSNKEDWRFTYIFPMTLISIILGLYFSSIKIALFIFIPVMYHIVRYLLAVKTYKEDKNAIIKAIETNGVHVSVEKLCSVREETIYEPYMALGNSRSLKYPTFFRFYSGLCWRMPLSYHYRWSKDFYLSPEGLEHISIVGDEFYYATLQGYDEIAYIYPCKYFEIDSSIIVKKEN